MNTARKLDKHLIMATTKPQERARLVCTVINLPVGVNNSVASRKENGYMSETSKRELVIACAAALMLILFFGSGTL